MAPVVYEVNVDVHPSIAEAYEAWLIPHVEKMFTLIEGLRSADICRREPTAGVAVPTTPEESAAGAELPKWHGLTITYKIDTKEALDDYLANRAGPMRQDAIDHFGTTKFKAFRRIMEPIFVK
jgi:hypothetical protein